MNKLVAAVAALCLLVAAAPATSLARDGSQPDLHAAKARPATS